MVREGVGGEGVEGWGKGGEMVKGEG